MKKYILLAFLQIPCFFLNAQINLNNRLVAYYPFTGNDNDVSGNGNNPDQNTAILTKDYYENPNSAYYFDGATSYIRIPNSPSLNPNNTISICAWIKPMGFYPGTCHGNRIIMKGDADYLTGNYLLTFDDNLYTNGQNCSSTQVDTIHQTLYGVATSNLVGDTP